MIRRLSRSLASGAATLALATALAGPVSAQGVPTVDTQNIAQEIESTAKCGAIAVGSH